MHLKFPSAKMMQPKSNKKIRMYEHKINYLPARINKWEAHSTSYPIFPSYLDLIPL